MVAKAEERICGHCLNEALCSMCYASPNVQTTPHHNPHLRIRLRKVARLRSLDMRALTVAVQTSCLSLSVCVCVCVCGVCEEDRRLPSRKSRSHFKALAHCDALCTLGLQP